MEIKKALEKFLKLDPVIVSGKTFDPESIEDIRLETGDEIYWIRDGGDLWLSIDPVSDEIILFSTVEEEVDSSGETVYYQGEDYEFEFEGNGKVLDDGNETDEIVFKDFEGSDGEVLRIAENMVTNEVEVSVGSKITEDDLQEV